MACAPGLKPAFPDLVRVGLERAGEAGEAVRVGDTPWDVQASERAGMKTIAVVTGGG